jgi:peptidoglycan LD-endopeptidase LytH
VSEIGDTRSPHGSERAGQSARGVAQASVDVLGITVALKLLAAAGAALIALGVFASLFTLLGTGTGEASEPSCSASPLASDGIPSTYMRLYQETGASFGLDWSVLAAVGQVESGHGANVGPSSAGALGPMQFLPSTWAAYGVDGDGDGRRDVMDPEDAIPGAARLLVANGAPANWERALFAYNHADWYVRQVLARAERYRGNCAAAEWPSGGGRLAWPVQGPVTSPFCERRSWERCHPGIDIGVSSGTPVHAAADGTVTLARPVSGYGNFICVTHTVRLTSCYAHLSQYRTEVGEEIKRGEVVALSGCSGRCFGPHLHFEVRRGPRFGAAVVDPLPYLEGAL